MSEDIALSIEDTKGQLVASGTDIVPIPQNPELAAWYKRPESCRDEAARRLGLVNKARSIKSHNKKKKVEALSRYAESQAVPLPTLYRYIKIADKALKTAEKTNTDAITAQIIALTPSYGGSKGAIKSFDKKALDYALKIYNTQSCLNISDVYKQTRNEAAVHGWRVGSDATLRRIISIEIDEGLKVLARKGVKKYQAECELKITRNYREIWPNFMWCGDHHIFDVFVRAPGGKVLRPWVTMWMDMSSRSYMGWCINFQPNSRTIALALAHAILEKDDEQFPQHGIPWAVYIDNGKDYRSQYLNGESVDIGKVDYPDFMERFSSLGIDPYYIDLEYDPGERAWMKKRGALNHSVKSIRVGGVYARLNIHQRYATAYHPWAKPIERSFRNVVQQFSRDLPGWCGSGHEQRPEKLSWEIRRGLLLDYEEFCQRFYNWVVHIYHKAPHAGHGMDGRSPDEVFRAYGAPQTIDPELISFALLKKDQVKIHNWGFNLLGREFELDIPADLAGAAILNKAINRYATILYDPDFKMVRVYLNGEFICSARRLQRASFIRPDDPVMIEKLKLQAYQKRLITQSIDQIRQDAPLSTMSEENALLELGRVDEDPEESFDNPLAPFAKGECVNEPIPLDAEERYRMILHKIVKNTELSERDRLWKEDYEASGEYMAMQSLYEAELNYLQYQHAQEAGR